MTQKPLGRVEAVQAFPVKSLQAGLVTAIELDEAGVVGDRRWAVVTDDGVLTADAAPRLREVVAVNGPAGAPVVTVEGAMAQGADADRALSAAIGRPVRLEPVAAGSTLDAPVHLVSRQALDAAARGEHDAADCACSLQEPRANLVLDLPGLREEQLVGRRLAVGSAVLRVVRRPNHCLGVYAEVDRPGRIRTEDEVRDA
jgi:MOSC domain-containing protein